MNQDRKIHRIPTGFKGIGFNDRMHKLLASIKVDDSSRTANWDEICAVAELARVSVGEIASNRTLRLMHQHNPAIFQIITDRAQPDRLIGFNAALPLNERGLFALIHNEMNLFAPDPAFIAKMGEAVSAIYVWLTYSPGSFLRSVKGLSDYVADMAPLGCPLFCRGATPQTHAFMVSVGYEEANRFYPQAKDGLLVVHPIAAKSTPAITVQLASSLNDMMQVFAVRAATYIAEQECPFDEEYDGNDFCAAHLIGHIDGEPAGCLRIRFFSDFVKFERLAVRKEYRQSKLAFRLVREAMRYAARKGYSRVYGHARIDLVRFWETFGFRKLNEAKQLHFSNIEFVEMGGGINADGNAVRIGDNPYRLIRPENRWDQPGPLERNEAVVGGKRIMEKLRTLQAA
jgi:predicted GNAT family N-acyltransferase